MSETTNKQRGGKRPGAGRKPRYGIPKEQKTVRLPPEWVAQLIAEFGSFQDAVETLVKLHLEKGYESYPKITLPNNPT